MQLCISLTVLYKEIAEMFDICFKNNDKKISLELYKVKKPCHQARLFYFFIP